MCFCVIWLFSCGICAAMEFCQYYYSGFAQKKQEVAPHFGAKDLTFLGIRGKMSCCVIYNYVGECFLHKST